MSTQRILVGAHVSIAKHIYLAFERGESIGCTAIQIFTKSSRSWYAKDLTEKEITEFKQYKKQSSIKVVVAHAGYLINLGSPKKETAQDSITSLIQEMDRCAQLEIPYLVLHPGAHLGAGEQIGLELISKNLDYVFEHSNQNVSILLETTAGQGTNLGYTFEQIKTLLSSSSYKKRLGVCLDTCHVFSAGYDLSSADSYKKIIHKFDTIIGLKHLKLLHLNNSKGTCGSRIDRHEPIKKGLIPLEIFQLIMQDKKLERVPKILETPTDDDMQLWREEIALLKEFIK